MALVLAALGFYLYLVEFPAKQSQEQQESAKRKLVSLEEQAITSLTFKSDREELVFERNADKGWTLINPIRVEADTRELRSLLRAIVLGSVHRVVEENPKALAPFGLARSAMFPVYGLAEATVGVSFGTPGDQASRIVVDRHALRIGQGLRSGNPFWFGVLRAPQVNPQ